MTQFAATIIALAMASTASAALMLYVSPDGTDANPGTEAQPFATPVRARDEIRARKSAGGLPEGGVIVEMAPGTYRLDESFILEEQDSGTEAAPIVYRCDPRARAWLNGGRAIPLVEFAPLTDANLRGRIPEEAWPYVRCLDLKAAGIAFYTRLPDYFNTYHGETGVYAQLRREWGFRPEYGFEGLRMHDLELFADGQRLTPARWPNRGFARFEIVEEGERVGWHRTAASGDEARPGVLRFAGDPERLKRWAAAEELILNGYFVRGYFSYSARMGAIDVEKSTIRHLTSGLEDKGGNRFYAQHLPEELDIPGEWYLHRPTGTLCVWPPEGVEEITFAVCAGPLVKMQNVSHVTLRGLGFAYGRSHAIDIVGGEANTVVACDIHNCSWHGVNVVEGRHHRVLGCDIHHMGRGGVWLLGGDPKTLEPGGHLAENNHIHRVGQLQPNYTSPLFLHGVGNRVAHNLIHHTPHIVVHIKGNDHIAEYNHIYLTNQDTVEAGIFYRGLPLTEQGTLIRYNFMHHIQDTMPGMGNRTAFVHLDDGASGTEIYGNVLYRAGHGVSICGGSANRVYNNLFVECAQAADISARYLGAFEPDGDGGFQAVGRLGGGPVRALRQIAWDRPPHSTRYPQLLELLTKKNPVSAPWLNEISRNIIAACDRAVVRALNIHSEWCAIEDNWTGVDPGFVQPDHALLDFRLKPDAEALAIGFAPIPFDRIGLYESPDRASWPVPLEPIPADWQPNWMAKRDIAGRQQSTLFPVDALAQGRRIVIDGHVTFDEWSPPGHDPRDPERHQTAEIRWGQDLQEVPFPSQAWIEMDETNLYIAFLNPVDPAHGVTDGHRWGRDDAVEICLARAAAQEHQGSEKPLVLQGFACGVFNCGSAMGLLPVEEERITRRVEYAARVVDQGLWSAEWRIPLDLLDIDPADSENRPILAHLAVRKPAGNHWASWSRRAGSTTRVHGAYALWLKPLGPLAFMPGVPPAHARIDITGSIELEPGEGCISAHWVRDGTRIMASFGRVDATQWKTCQFTFTPRGDGMLRIELMGAVGTPIPWTWYDDFRVQGTSLANPDFEDNDGWNCMQEERNKKIGLGQAAIVSVPDRAASGARVAQASHDHRVTQNIAVKAGEPITIRFRARAAMP